jgi:hypothetical protein
MMKTLLVCALLLTAAVGPASAAGLNLGWNDCAGLGAGAVARTFACTSNTGANTMIGSFVAPSGLTEVTGFAAVLDLQTSAATLPDWWNFGGCRVATAILHSASFAAGPFSCFDYFAGGATGAGVYIIGAGAPKQARIKEGWALPSSSTSIGPIAVDTETYAFSILINNSRSTGPVACAGCGLETCIVFNEILVTNRPGNPNGNKIITNTATRAHVTWQGWTNPNPNQGCPDVTPAINRTWGSIKAIYR